MKTITFDDIKDLNVSPAKCYDWVSEMIASKDDALLPAKIHMSMPDAVFCNVMPSIVNIEGRRFGGVKIVTRYPQRKPALDSKILLFDAETGEFLSLMDGNWITAMRTGAVAAHSVVHFAKENYMTIGMIGLGNTARAALLVLSDIEKSRTMTIKLLKYKDQAELFKERFSENKNLGFVICDDAETVVKGSDVVISCATYFEDDICSDEAFDEGVLIVPVHTRGFTNCDLFFDKVFADDTGHVDHFKNFSKFKYYAEVCDVVNNRKTGRENDKERILAYNIGISTHDIYFAGKIYQLFKDDTAKFNRLADLDLHDPATKFWV